MAHYRDDLYSNYLARIPSPFGEKLIRWWHSRMLARVSTIVGEPRRVLEVGPGHGYFAQECQTRSIDYYFCDNSGAVHHEMTAKGFSGSIALLQDLQVHDEPYDLIWMSHVLEHSPTWVDARSMLQSARHHIGESGSVAVISPDFLSWRRQFWNVDATHGFPTTVRNVVQLFNDVGLTVSVAKHHRGASFSLVVRGILSILCALPHGVIDSILDLERARVGEGYLSSWKAIFGWRQILIVGTIAEHTGDL